LISHYIRTNIPPQQAIKRTSIKRREQYSIALTFDNFRTLSHFNPSLLTIYLHVALYLPLRFRHLCCQTRVACANARSLNLRFEGRDIHKGAHIYIFNQCCKNAPRGESDILFDFALQGARPVTDFFC
jgi:hypothetical protein